MFQVELGRMMREQQQMDYRREAKCAKQPSVDNQARRTSVGEWLVLPFILATLVSRLIVFSSHLIRH